VSDTVLIARVRPLLLLIAVTAVWGVTFVQVKDAVAIYPLFAFFAVRFLIGSAALALPAAPRLRTLGRAGLGAACVAGLLLGTGYALQTAGLERTTVSATGFITGMQTVLTPVLALLLFRMHTRSSAWFGVALSLIGLALLAGVHRGSVTGDLLVLAGAAAYAAQIVLMERFAPRFDAVAFTFVELLVVCLGTGAIALALGDLAWPHGWTVWGALLVTGLFASAFAFLAQVWAQRRTTATRTALAFAMEPVWAAFFGITLAGDRLGAVGWLGCAVILSGVLVAEFA
jgi:drug/metabolite transporter (DMT)-like permease